MKRKLAYSMELIIRIVIGLAFLYAGIHKMYDLESFAKTIDAFGLVPETFVYPLTIMIPMVEIICGAGFVLGNRESIFMVSTMLIVFIAVLSFGIFKGLDIDCGCYGPNNKVAESLSSLKTSLIRDFVMLSGIFFIVLRRSFLKEPVEH